MQYTHQAPHHFLSVTKYGHSAIVSTTGSEDCHVIVRGGRNPNYSGDRNLLQIVG
jgi:3-deoxy-7-phosphoheptulonate synthase